MNKAELAFMLVVWIIGAVICGSIVYTAGKVAQNSIVKLQTELRY